MGRVFWPESLVAIIWANPPLQYQKLPSFLDVGWVERRETQQQKKLPRNPVSYSDKKPPQKLRGLITFYSLTFGSVEGAIAGSTMRFGRPGLRLWR